MPPVPAAHCYIRLSFSGKALPTGACSCQDENTQAGDREAAWGQVSALSVKRRWFCSIPGSFSSKGLVLYLPACHLCLARIVSAELEEACLWAASVMRADKITLSFCW